MPIQVIVTFMNNSVGYFPVPEDAGWRIDCSQRLIVIGHCLERTTIPLDNVMCFQLEEYKPKTEDTTIQLFTDQNSMVHISKYSYIDRVGKTVVSHCWNEFEINQVVFSGLQEYQGTLTNLPNICFNCLDNYRNKR